MDLTDEAERETRRQMLATVARERPAAEERLDKERAKLRKLEERVKKSLEDAEEKLREFRKGPLATAQSEARGALEAERELYALAVPRQLVLDRDRAEAEASQVRLALAKHDKSEREAERLLSMAKNAKRLDKKTAKEWRAKIAASQAERTKIVAALTALERKASVAQQALSDAQEAALSAESRV